MKVSSNCSQCGKMIPPYELMCTSCDEKFQLKMNAHRDQEEIDKLKKENIELKKLLKKEASQLMGKTNE